MMRRVVFPAILLALCAVGASAQVHVGAGSQSCGEWISARRGKKVENTIMKGMIGSFVFGYLAGSAESDAICQGTEAIVDGMKNGTLPPDPDAPEILAFNQKRFGTLSGWTFDPPDGAAINAWLDKYCSANPLEGILTAAETLSVELASRAKKSPKR